MIEVTFLAIASGLRLHVSAALRSGRRGPASNAARVPARHTP